jgi:hypothetical protein
MALQRAHLARIVGPARGGRDQRGRRLPPGDRVETGRLVQQEGGGLGRFQHGVGIQLDALVRHRMLGRFDDLAVHPHPAVLDVVLGIGARTPDQFGHALGESDGIAHRGVMRLSRWGAVLSHTLPPRTGMRGRGGAESLAQTARIRCRRRGTALTCPRRALG